MGEITTYFSRVPEAHLLYVTPPACCRSRCVGSRSFQELENTSFLVLDEADVALGDFEGLIAGAVRRLAPFLSPQPKVIQICTTCPFPVLGVAEDILVETLEKQFPQYRFMCFPIHHLWQRAKPMPPESRELAMYGALRDARPQENAVNIIEGSIKLDDSSELYRLLKLCGVETIRQELDLQTFDEYERLTSAKLNILLGRMGIPTCRYLEERYGIPWIQTPKTYRLPLIQENMEAIAGFFQSEVPDVGQAVERCREAAARTAGLYRGHPLVVGESNNVDSLDLAQALVEYGFEVIAVDSHFPPELRGEKMRALHDVCPQVQPLQEHHTLQVSEGTVVLSSEPMPVQGTDMYCTCRSHGEPLGFARVLHFMEELEAFAQERW